MYPITTAYCLLPNTLHELRDIWVKIITTNLLKFLTWAHPTLNTTNSNNCLTLQLRLATFAEPDYNPPHSISSDWKLTETSKITQATLTRHFTTNMCTNKIKNILDFPAILKWRVKHQCLLNFNWMQTLCLIHNKGIMFKNQEIH